MKMNQLAQPLINTPRPLALAKWLLAAIVAALIPLVAALVLLVSVARNRPLLDRHEGASPSGRALTTVWGIGLLAIAILQGASAILANMSVTKPTDILIRTVASLALEGAIYAGLRLYESRQR
jgi:quinol-cytochrome oxidoreductase complex cytochrome b subunit